MASIRSVELVIGLEIHVQLATRTKMFSRSPSPARDGAASRDPAIDGPNTAIDPVVLGLPGALPVPNARALELAARVGVALGCAIAPAGLTRWDRKSYFYPDLPKGYQISQLEHPICGPGAFRLPCPSAKAGSGTGPVAVDWQAEPRVIRIARAHLEEDAGKLLHEAPADGSWSGGAGGGGPGGGRALEYSIVDFNRAGTALLEIVTEPDFRTADEVVLFCQALRQICRYVGATPGVLQKGHMRFEPNINCRLGLDDGRVVSTPITEVKNLNSFAAVRGAIEYEAREQPRRYQSDGRVMGPGAKSTRGWDDVAGVTVPQREKEDAQDYRYFPDPDLPTVRIDADWVAARREEVPRLPFDRQKMYLEDLGLSPKEAAALTEEREDSDLFEAGLAAAERQGVPKDRAGRLVANLLLQSGAKRRGKGAGAASQASDEESPDAVEAATADRLSDLGITGEHLGSLAWLRDSGSVSAAGADAVFGALIEPANRGADPQSLASSMGVIVIRDDAAMAGWVEAALVAQPQAAADVRAGKEAAIGRLVGAAMKASGGQGDAATLRGLILQRLRRT